LHIHAVRIFCNLRSAARVVDGWWQRGAPGMGQGVRGGPPAQPGWIDTPTAKTTLSQPAPKVLSRAQTFSRHRCGISPA